jgi:hypothetical protein
VRETARVRAPGHLKCEGVCGLRTFGGSSRPGLTDGGRGFFGAGQMGDERGIQEQNVAIREIAPRLSLNSQCIERILSPSLAFSRPLSPSLAFARVAVATVRSASYYRTPIKDLARFARPMDKRAASTFVIAGGVEPMVDPNVHMDASFLEAQALSVLGL